jgi:hypothetical protein
MADAPEPARFNKYAEEQELERLALPLKGATATPKPKGDSLCYRCKHSMIYRRSSSFDYVIRCEALPGTPQMPHDIIECSEYRTVTSLSLADMSEMAYRVDDREEPKGPYR